MVEGDPGIAALLDAARVDFARGLPAKVAAVEAHVADGAFADAKRAAHKLRGSAGMFGYTNLGRIAGEIDDLMNEATGVDGEAGRARLHALVAQLGAEAACPEGGGT
ncbi:MAG TPA: Hpt domain-containing protein [Polyangiaceae bacterium]|jgi:HPt (histidine-containing phosphotransfer) domain-containing protein